ncbi:urea ABC transporter permease subunit UrtC [Candidatus Epulonipiscium viviparus]|uniref:urea ABC transporter permease subunit UrtC n=1 Tax=Candidatus Epulonipiscium viviparus TaxID=420336 RepID=UPI0005C4914D|nr:urea ABC transporter permease subunit UrtC [Candidatus Epulopiscium viviparus]
MKGKGENISFAVIVIILAMVPVLLQLNLIGGSSTVIFIGKCMAYAIVAIGIDLIWGYTGILSLGHGLYFALGGYGMAMYLKLVSTGGEITDFMRVGGIEELPLIWKIFEYLPNAMFFMIAIPAAVSFLVGYMMFKNRVKGVYFSIISQALTWAMYSIFISLSPYTNGNVGITEIKSLFGSVKGDANRGNMFLLFYATLAVLILVYVFAKFLVGRKFGRVLVAIRDGENRTYFSGYSVSLFKTFVYVLSAVIAAVAGAIFVNFNGSITPSEMTIEFSIMMVIWVAVGGRGTIIGAVIGAFLINIGQYNLSSGIFVEAWQYIIGAVFCLTILFFKGGLVGLAKEQIPAAIAKLKKRKSPTVVVAISKEA